MDQHVSPDEHDAPTSSCPPSVTLLIRPVRLARSPRRPHPRQENAADGGEAGEDSVGDADKDPLKKLNTKDPFNLKSSDEESSALPSPVTAEVVPVVIAVVLVVVVLVGVAIVAVVCVPLLTSLSRGPSPPPRAVTTVPRRLAFSCKKTTKRAKKNTNTTYHHGQERFFIGRVPEPCVPWEERGRTGGVATIQRINHSGRVKEHATISYIPDKVKNNINTKSGRVVVL